jgi:hypothetical protein
MDRTTPSYGQGVLSGFINLLIVVAALVILYYAFRFFYGTSTEQGVTVISDKMTANQGAKTFSNVARLYEGGEYTVNFWMYIGGWKQNQGTRKHVLELGGPNFSTLLIALGAFKNSLSVRVHTQNIPGLTDASGNPTDASGNRAAAPVAVAGMAANMQDTSLSMNEKNNFFKPLTMDDGLLNVAPTCDIDSIDLQRWVQVTVVLNGRTCDVYIDGKLARSCVLRNFYRVDPSFSGMVVTDRGGFDGYMSQVSTYNYSLTPDVIYKMYMAGPTATSLDPFKYLASFFQKQQ